MPNAHNDTSQGFLDFSPNLPPSFLQDLNDDLQVALTMPLDLRDGSCLLPGGRVVNNQVVVIDGFLDAVIQEEGFAAPAHR
jgi:hypothetical protein